MRAVIKDNLNTVLRGYAAILFQDNPWAGLAFLAASFWYPQIGFAGLLATLCSHVAVTLLRFGEGGNAVYIYNSLLAGLSLGAFFEPGGLLVIMIIFTALICTLATLALQSLFHLLKDLPVLSLPFVITAVVCTFSADLLPGVNRSLQFDISATLTGTPWIDAFLGTLGAIFFTPHPAAGLLVMIGLLLSSRYMAVLALCGFVTATIGFQLLNISLSPELLMWTGFNFILITMALAGFYTIPGTPALVFGLVAALLATPLVLVVQVPVINWGLPVMITPFIIITLGMLLVLRHRHSLMPPHLAPVPGIPEQNYERLRLARVRNGNPHSIPVLAPFFGAWTVYQGFDDRFTHQSDWRHALDFFMLKEGRSFAGSGNELEDYYCYNLPVVSPAHGTVVRVTEHIPDNPPGRVDTFNNWGNLVLIRLDNGLYVLLAHLKSHSIKVREGDRIRPGTLLGRCGNSGRSTQPHLHLHVQTAAPLGSPTCPFHLSGIIRHDDRNGHEYLLVCVPKTGDLVQNAGLNTPLATGLHLPPGRVLAYEILDHDDNPVDELRLCAELDLGGQCRLVSNRGAVAVLEEVNGVLGFYQRSGERDRFMDAWLLANGLTPFSDQALHWEDEPGVHLADLGLMQRLLIRLWFPLGAGLRSSYSRHWDADNGFWVQSARHRLPIGSDRSDIKTTSVLHPDFGFAWFSLEKGPHSFHARLISSGGSRDEGIPEWRFSVPSLLQPARPPQPGRPVT